LRVIGTTPQDAPLLKYFFSRRSKRKQAPFYRCEAWKDPLSRRTEEYAATTAAIASTRELLSGTPTSPIRIDEAGLVQGSTS
jgi:hypothetical protein